VSNVVIVSTSYDRASAITRSWAATLNGALLNNGVVNVHLDGTLLDAPALQALMQFADYFVFFGHGTASSLIAHPLKGFGNHRDLVDTANAPALFHDCVVYAVCCDALQVLASRCPRGFIGYDDAFPVRETMERHFSDVIIASVMSLLQPGVTLGSVVARTEGMWRNLAKDFDIGRLNHMVDSAWGKTTAEALANQIGKWP
jgi:hypothetical protein